MSESNAPMQRLTELLTEEAATGLDPREASELEELMGAGAGLARDEFMTVASLLQVGFLHKDRRSQERMPDEVREKVAQQAKSFFAQGPARNDPGSVSDIQAARRARREKASRASRWFNLNSAGWYVAAALALALVVVRGGPESQPGPLDAQRSALMAQGDVIVAPWTAAAAAEGYENVTGDVVWSDERQAGYMRLASLVANDPGTAQYQLWIVDPDRDERPVDGGVFDVPAGAGEVIVPIDPKLEIDGPAAFAITLEKPGGVVVSGGPLLVVAPVAG